MLEKHRELLKQGAVLVDPADEGTEPRVLLVIDHGIRDASAESVHNQARLVSRRLHFVDWHPDGRVTNAGPAPYLDYRVLAENERQHIGDILAADWLGADLETRAIAHAAQKLVPEHLHEIKTRRQTEVDKTLSAAHERLVKEINYWSTRAIKLQEEVQAGRQPRMQRENARRRAEELTERLARRPLPAREVRSTRRVVRGRRGRVRTAEVLLWRSSRMGRPPGARDPQRGHRRWQGGMGAGGGFEELLWES